MTDLVEFLRARLDEDEAVARAATPRPDVKSALRLPASKAVEDLGEALRGRPLVRPFTERFTPAWVLAEVAAKRRIIDLCEPWGLAEDIAVMRLLAQPYDKHPDFDPAWILSAPAQGAKA